MNKVKESKLLGFARITFNNSFVLSGLRIYQGENGVFVVYPYASEVQHFICFPIRAELRQKIEEAIEVEYHIETNLAHVKQGPIKCL